jgi:hypothetical protein
MPSADASSDRRASARSQSFILVTTSDGGGPMWASDIGLGGMQCKSQTLRWPGAYLDVEFTIPDTRETVNVGAQVLSLNRDRDDDLTLGLRFCRISGHDQLAIYRFLDRRRCMWDPTAEPETPRRRSLAQRHPALAALLGQEQPFASLVAEAQSTLARLEAQADRTLRRHLAIRLTALFAGPMMRRHAAPAAIAA